jgi:hypothetical protein
VPPQGAASPPPILGRKGACDIFRY